MKTFGFVVASLFLLSSAYAAPSTFKLKERLPITPRGWTRKARAPADHIIELRIALPQPNFDLLEKNLYEVSDPFHERYGNHLSKEEVEALVAPHPHSVKQVDEWLASHGCMPEDITRSPAKDWVIVKVPVETAEKMLDTQYHIWQHDEGDYLVRTMGYSLPEQLHEHVELIQPTTLFGRYRQMRSTIHSVGSSSSTGTVASTNQITSSSGTTVPTSCDSAITLSCLFELYNAVGYEASNKTGNQIAIASYLEQFANRQDLQDFYAVERPEAVGTTFNLISIAGGQNNQTPSEAGVEANLDTQFAFGLAWPIPATVYTTGGSPPFIPDDDTPTDTNEPYLSWLGFVLDQKDVPQTISTSYGDDEQTVPESFAQRACAGFAQLGARGVSLTSSSGDGGVGDGNPDPATQTCFTNDGTNTTKFIPLFPASCPFITAVGGTVNVNPEMGVFFSGGGFSNYFSRPSYQDAAVTKFLDHELPKGTYAGLFNPNGRGIPDVAAQADFFQVFIAGIVEPVAGTSCASPTFAGFVALLNDARLKKGLPTLGFLNPLLYTKGVAGLTDITSGNNPGCGTEGFNATVGWDPITGLGTPNFGKLKAIVAP